MVDIFLVRIYLEEQLSKFFDRLSNFYLKL